METYQPIPYGARCTWWDSIDKVGTIPGFGLPCCPICKNVLLQVSSLDEWNGNVRRYADEKADPDYVLFIEWLRGRCFPNFEVARRVWRMRSVFPPDIGKATSPVDRVSRGRPHHHGRFG